jgi:N-acyl-L-homoserine lactone synthetase
MDMSNIASLADSYADIKAEIEGLNRLLEEVREEILKTGYAELVGTRSIVNVSMSEPNRFDAAAAKKLLTEEQIAACTKRGKLQYGLTIKAVKAPSLVRG